LKKLHLNIGLLLGILALSACNPRLGTGLSGQRAVEATFSTTMPSLVLSTATQALIETVTPQPSATLSPTHTPQPTATSTQEPYAGYRIDDLTTRSYGGGDLVVEEILAQNSYFTRYLISYPSDGLKIYGFMNVPKKGNPPYPVVIGIHGYIEPEIYNTLDYTTRYADALARSGYLVIHPNLRGYPPSDSGDNLFRVGMAIDVLNLIALVKTRSGQPGPLGVANGEEIGVWGHSMGGGISTRVITVNPDVKAAVLYGAMSGDEKKNYERIFTYFSNGQRGLDELMVPDEVIQQVSPINYLERIQAAVSIHHGKNDVDVPLEWSLDLCQRLQVLGKTVECFTYKDEPHTFNGAGDDLFTLRMVTFYDKFLKNR
jgi:dipeptidyl aminopeptidase/acylaminoacyl peptidase